MNLVDGARNENEDLMSFFGGDALHFCLEKHPPKIQFKFIVICIILSQNIVFVLGGECTMGHHVIFTPSPKCTKCEK